LEELGHIAHAPTLPGHGPHVATGAGHQEAGDAVARYIAECDLHDIVLVGHSGGGVAISKAVELIADRVERFVYVNGWVLKDSEFILGLVPPHYRELFASMAAESPNNTVEVPFEIWRSSFINDADYAAAKSAFAQLVPEPFSYLVELVNLTIFHSLTIPKSYILPTEDIALPRDRAWGWHPRMTNRLGDHRFLEMPGSHEVMFTNPRLQSCSHAGLPVGQRGRNLAIKPSHPPQCGGTKHQFAQSEGLIRLAFSGVVVVICSRGGVGNVVPLTHPNTARGAVLHHDRFRTALLHSPLPGGLDDVQLVEDGVALTDGAVQRPVGAVTRFVKQLALGELQRVANQPNSEALHLVVRLESLADPGQDRLVVIAQRLGVTEVVRLGELQADDTDSFVSGVVESNCGCAQPLLGKARAHHRGRLGSSRRTHRALDEDLSRFRLEMLVQQPDTEAIRRIGGDEILAQLFQAGAVVLAQFSDVGGIHVPQRLVILDTVIAHRQHRSSP
jgi:hypothetical protein